MGPRCPAGAPAAVRRRGEGPEPCWDQATRRPWVVRPPWSWRYLLQGLASCDAAVSGTHAVLARGRARNLVGAARLEPDAAVLRPSPVRAGPRASCEVLLGSPKPDKSFSPVLSSTRGHPRGRPLCRSQPGRKTLSAGQDLQPRQGKRVHSRVSSGPISSATPPTAVRLDERPGVRTPSALRPYNSGRNCRRL